MNFPCDDNITSIPTTDEMSEINTNPSTHNSFRLFSRSKHILHEYNSNLILTKQNLSHQIHRSISTSDYIDWTHTSSMKSTNNNRLNAKNFLQEYLKNGNYHILLNILDELAEEINFDENQNHCSYSAINNNHFHLSPTFNPNFQISNNKEKKNKKEKSDEKEKKESTKENKKKENDSNEMISKTPKKKKEKTKKIEESITTTTSDSEVVADSPVSRNPASTNHHYPRYPAETIGFPSLSIPVPYSNGLSTTDSLSPDPSSPVAHLSQVQHQLQTDLQTSSLNKTTKSHNMSVQQQLQSLSQMARDGDEILITLSVNALTQKQQANPQQNPYFSQPWHQIMPSSTELVMPRNVEIVAKGFARVHNEHPQQQSMIHAYNQPVSMMVQPPFVPRYPIPCSFTNGPPSTPIGPPVQPIFASPNMMMSNGFVRPPNCTNFPPNIRNNFDETYHRSHLNTGKCDYLCQSSLYQPDFRGRPLPGQMNNPYISNPSPSQNFSAKRSSKLKTNRKSHRQHHNNCENINRTYSSIY